MKERDERVRVVLEGPFFHRHSFAVVNRELSLGLLRTGRIDIMMEVPGLEAEALYGERISIRETRRYEQLIPLSRRSPRGQAQVRIRHLSPPRFDPPEEPWWVMIQPWEYTSAPRAYVGPMRDQATEVWVPSNFVKQAYVNSGIPAEKIHVIPNGIDPAVFHPGAQPLALRTGKGFRFLFAGPMIWRKGFDILLNTYLRTFRRGEDVCLVVKEFGASSYDGRNAQIEAIRRAQADPRNPEILYLGQDIMWEDLAGLYTTCQCLVHPFRGEGFGLPMAEAMACGLPVVVPQYGPCLDFCDKDTAYLLPAKELPYPENRKVPCDMVHYPTVAEVDPEELGARMRHVFQHYDQAQEVGRRASERIRREFSWDRAAALAAGRLERLAQLVPCQPVPSPADLVRYGKERMWAGEFRRARVLFRRAIRIRGACPQAHAYFVVTFLPIFAINLLRKLGAVGQQAWRRVVREREEAEVSRGIDVRRPR